jgi:hypothetical protein
MRWIVGCLLVFVSCACALADEVEVKAIHWSPRFLQINGNAGAFAEATVTLESNRTLKDVEFAFSHSLRDIATVEPRNLSTIEAGVPVSLTIVFSVPAAKKHGKNFVIGALRAEVDKHRRQEDSDRFKLPIVLHILQPPNLDFSNASLYSNPTTPFLLSFVTAGLNARFDGSRDSQGTPLSVNAIDLQDTTTPTSPSSRLSLDSQGRPLAATLGDGSQLTFNWTSTTTLVATAVTADGKYQANVALDIAAPAAATSQTADPVGAKILGALSAPVLPRRQTTQKKPFFLATPATAQAALQSSSLSAGVINTTVSATGQPVSGAQVTGIITPHGGGFKPYSTYSVEISPGTYQSPFENFNAALPQDQILERCDAIVGAVSNTCELAAPTAKFMIAGGCALLDVAVVGASEGAESVLEQCLGFFENVEHSCAIPEQAPQGVDEAFCANIVGIIDYFDPNGVHIDMTASKDGVMKSGQTDVPSGDTEAAVAIELPLPVCSISTFTTNPVSPAAFESYVTTAATTCGAPTDTISITDHGTDGFVEQLQCSAVAVCNMDVPGGAQGVIDTLVVTTSSGATRTTTLVFQ